MEKEVYQLLTSIFDVKSGETLENIILEMYSEWDSYNIIQLLATLMDKYQIKAELEELWDFDTLQDVFDWIIEKGK